MNKPILKSYYNEIFFEFLAQTKKSDTIVMLPGFPSSNYFDKLIYALYENGYNIFIPRYRGTYQSKGEFLETNLIVDLVKFVSFLKKGQIISLWDNKEIHFKTRNFIVAGSSFGGSVACALAASSKDIAKAIVVSPVWDFSNHNKEYKEQDLRHITEFIKRAYVNLYRYSFRDIGKKMNEFKETHYEYYKSNLKIPVIVYHDPSDKIVSIEHSKKAAGEIENVTLVETNTGHGALSEDMF